MLSDGRHSFPLATFIRLPMKAIPYQPLPLPAALSDQCRHTTSHDSETTPTVTLANVVVRRVPPCSFQPSYDFPQRLYHTHRYPYQRRCPTSAAMSLFIHIRMEFGYVPFGSVQNGALVLYE
jgi:hypothetical protein